MKIPRWLPYAGIVAFYVTLVVLGRIWLTPIYAYRYESERTATMRRWSAVRDRVVYENERLRELMVRDSLVKVLPRAPGLYIVGLSDSVDVLVNRRGAEPLVAKASLREIAEREAGAAPRASISIVGVPALYGGHAEVRQGVGERMHFSGIADGRPYCVAAIRRSTNALERHEWLALTRSGMLGQCAFWARYGTPGPHIHRWLNSGGAHFAGSDYKVGMERDVSRLGMPEYAPGGQRRFFIPLAGQACLAGRLDVCARAIANPRTIYGRPDSARHLVEWDERIAPGERLLLARLQNEFGEARFQRFWTSDRPFEEAFEAAFGVELGTWVHDWMEPFGRINRGARLGGDSVLLTLLLIGICAGLALATAQRRRV